MLTSPCAAVVNGILCLDLAAAFITACEVLPMLNELEQLEYLEPHPLECRALARPVAILLPPFEDSLCLLCRPAPAGFYTAKPVLVGEWLSRNHSRQHWTLAGVECRVGLAISDKTPKL